MKKLSLGDMMSYWGIDYVKKSRENGAKYEAVKGYLVFLGNTPLDAVHNAATELKRIHGVRVA